MDTNFVNLGRTPEEKDYIARKASAFYLEKEVLRLQREVANAKSYITDEKKFNSYLHFLQREADNFLCHLRTQLQEAFAREFAKEKHNAKLHQDVDSKEVHSGRGSESREGCSGAAR